MYKLLIIYFSDVNYKLFIIKEKISQVNLYHLYLKYKIRSYMITFSLENCNYKSRNEND